jgi:hypothetical protein
VCVCVSLSRIHTNTHTHTHTHTTYGFVFCMLYVHMCVVGRYHSLFIRFGSLSCTLLFGSALRSKPHSLSAFLEPQQQPLYHATPPHARDCHLNNERHATTTFASAALKLSPGYALKRSRTPERHRRTSKPPSKMLYWTNSVVRDSSSSPTLYSTDPLVGLYSIEIRWDRLSLTLDLFPF